jgi:hypothetical protein
MKEAELLVILELHVDTFNKFPTHLTAGFRDLTDMEGFAGMFRTPGGYVYATACGDIQLELDGYREKGDWFLVDRNFNRTDPK